MSFLAAATPSMVGRMNRTLTAKSLMTRSMARRAQTNRSVMNSSETKQMIRDDGKIIQNR